MLCVFIVVVPPDQFLFDSCNEAQKFIKITRMELIFNARQLSRCPELPAGNGNYACWQKSTASSSEQRRNSRLQDGKTLEGLQARPDPVYEPMSVSLIFRLGQKESRWTPQQESSGIRFYRSFNMLVSNFKKDFYALHLRQNCIWAPLFAAILTTSST
jgi:hypothetical protein